MTARLPLPDERTIYSSAREDEVAARAWPVLSDSVLDLLRSAGEVLHAGAGDILWEAGDPYDLNLVLTGGVRDSQALAALGWPVFSGRLCIRGTVKDPLGAGTLGSPVRIGDVEVARGDLVLGDADGVLVIPSARAHEVAEESRRRDEKEVSIMARLRAGETTLAIYGLPDLGDNA